MTGDFFDFRGWFRREYEGYLGPLRYPTFHAALNWFFQTGGKTIVEAGTMRKDDGRSTFIFGDCLSRRGGKGKLWTVDIDPLNLEFSARETSPFAGRIAYVRSDSAAFLRSFSEAPVDLLYLDSLDYDPKNPEPSQAHNLAELEAALPRLAPRACVLIDDNLEPGGGKGELSKAVLPRDGFVCLLDFYQSLWVRM